MAQSLAEDKDVRKVPPRQVRTKDPALVTFGSRIRELRLAKDWSQEELAAAADIHVVQLSHIENGRNEAKLTTILKLARALSVSPAELFKPFDRRR